MYATTFIEGLIWSVLWIIYVYVIVTSDKKRMYQCDPV